MAMDGEAPRLNWFGTGGGVFSVPPLVGDGAEEAGVGVAGECRLTAPSFCGDVGRWKGEGTGGAIDGEALRVASDGLREADLR